MVQRLADRIAERPPFADQPEKMLEWEGGARRVALESRLFEDADAFLHHAARQATEEASGEKEQGVCISTIHQAKGLEWRAVFLVGCRTGVMPHDDARDLEEERRLAYVAATRAKDFLAVSWPYRQSGSGEPGPSPYVGELTASLPVELRQECSWPEGFSRPRPRPEPGAPARAVHPKPGAGRTKGVANRAKSSPKAQKSRARTAATEAGTFVGTAPFAKGDRVRHPVHGRGVVRELKRDSCMVSFLEDGYIRDIPYRQLKRTT